MIVNIAPSGLSGTIAAPPSKSIAHRAVICAGLAKGTSTISNLALSGDIEASIGAIMRLGADVALEDTGSGLYRAIITGGTPPRDINIDCGESGSTLRFILPLTLALADGAMFLGRGRLGERPLGIYRDICESQGIVWQAPESGLPLTLKGRLFPGKYLIPGNVSSQFITGLLLALPLLGGSSMLKVTGKLESRPYVDLTLYALKKHGIKLKEMPEGLFNIPGRQQYQPQSYAVEGDWSQAAFLIAFGALGGGIRITDLNPESAQGDKFILDILSRMGGNYDWEEDTLVVEHSSLSGVDIDLADCPDLAPPVAALCAAAQGQSRLTGIQRLRLKESDRVESIAACIRAVGGSIQIEEQRIHITGSALTGGTVDSFGDHRIAMMAAALSPACSGKIKISGAESVNKSWTGFWDDFSKLGGKLL